MPGSATGVHFSSAQVLSGRTPYRASVFSLPAADVRVGVRGDPKIRMDQGGKPDPDDPQTAPPVGSPDRKKRGGRLHRFAAWAVLIKPVSCVFGRRYLASASATVGIKSCSVTLCIAAAGSYAQGVDMHADNVDVPVV